MQEDPRIGGRPAWQRHLFHPILAGATLGDRLFASLGALVGIALTAALCGLAIGAYPQAILLVPPMGASAVLLFAVPASPLAQPWPTIGGNVVSALIGIAVGHLVSEPALAAGIAVCGAIAAMSLLRCIHPPGGAAALVAVFGGPAVTSAGFLFPVVPVGINAVLLVGTAWLFHKVSGHSYPHVPKPAAAPAHGTTDKPPAERVGVSEADIDQVLSDLGETFDISTADLERVVRAVETRALARPFTDLSCADIMSRDIVTIDPETRADAALDLLARHRLHVLPVTGAERRVLGLVGYPELERADGRVADVMRAAQLASPGTPALELAQSLTGDVTHAVMIVDESGRLLGMVTQTDLLGVMTSGVSGAIRNRAYTPAE